MHESFGVADRHRRGAQLRASPGERQRRQQPNQSPARRNPGSRMAHGSSCSSSARHGAPPAELMQRRGRIRGPRAGGSRALQLRKLIGHLRPKVRSTFPCPTLRRQPAEAPLPRADAVAQGRHTTGRRRRASRQSAIRRGVRRRVRGRRDGRTARPLPDRAQARRGRDGRRLRRARREAPAHGRVEDDVVARRRTRRRASASGARRVRPRPSTIRTSARSTKSARTTACCSSPWSCSRARRCPRRLKGAPLSVAETVSTGLGILNALSALHARGVIHRDLKPSNVFLTPHGVKLLDFGLARPTAHELVTGAHELTRAGAVMGTPRYMSPEQALGETLDGRTDLFADRRDPVRDARRPARVHRQHRGRDSARDGLRAAAGPERVAGGRVGRSRHPPRARQEGRRDVRRPPRRWPTNCATSRPATTTRRR